MNVFATIDHAAGAKEAGIQVRPATLMIIGNAKGGTPLMLDNQLMGSCCRCACCSGRTNRARRTRRMSRWSTLPSALASDEQVIALAAV